MIGLKGGIVVIEMGMGKIGFSWEVGRLIVLWKDEELLEWGNDASCEEREVEED